MKKLIIFLLMIGLLPIGTFADFTATDVGAGVAGETPVGDTMELTHAVGRMSTFTVAAQGDGLIDDVDETHVATVSIKNNTRDGYSLEVTPTSGVLSPAETSDGEIPIDYALSYQYTGELGGNLRKALDAPPAGHKFGHQIAAVAVKEDLSIIEFQTAKDRVTSESDISIKIFMVLADALEDQLSLAGTYEETLTFTYTEI